MAGSGGVIEAHELCKSFGEVRAVRQLSFSVGAGQVVGLLGPNGAGKTTTVRMMTTLTAIDSGSATVGGYDVATHPHIVRRLIGLAGQSAAVDEKLTGRQNLELFGRLYKIPKTQRRRRVEELIERFDMGDFADRPAGTYSGGQRRRLDVIAALVAGPPALFLDEPTTGLDPRSRVELWDTIRQLASEGAAILLTSHYLDEVDRLADEILVLDRGKAVATGSPDTLKRELGRDVLEIHFAGADDLAGALEVFSGVAGIISDAASHRVDIPVGDGAAMSLALLRRLEDRGVAIADFQLRRPTLDDVFLALTGAPATEGEETLV